LARALEEFATYIDNNAGGIVNHGERQRCGERISTGFGESTINQLVAKQFVKKQQMRWTPRGPHLLPQIRVQALNGDLHGVFERWYPGLGRNRKEVSSSTGSCVFGVQHSPLAAEFVAYAQANRARAIHRDGFDVVIVIGEQLSARIAQIFAVRLHAPAVFPDAKRSLIGREGSKVIHRGVALRVEDRRDGGTRERVRLMHRSDLEKRSQAVEGDLVSGADGALKGRRAGEWTAERSAKICDLRAIRIL
jgi:hypothetical protein